MDKKGFTLAEILIVIILLGILITFTVTSIIKVRERSIQSLYNNKITYIESGAKEWGNDNLNKMTSEDNEGNKYSCQLVEDLIDEGYLTGDNSDKSLLLNPKDNSNFNSSEVCIKYVHTESNGIHSYKIAAEYNGNCCNQ